jgi:hypothetical protein
VIPRSRFPYRLAPLLLVPLILVVAACADPYAGGAVRSPDAPPVVGVRLGPRATGTPAVDPTSAPTAVTTPDPTPAATPPPDPTASPTPPSDPTPTATPTADPPPVATATPPPVPVPVVAPLPAGAPASPSLLDHTRIVSVYGAPNVPAMGLLGSYTPEGAAEEAVRLAQQYAPPAGTLPVLPAFHLVTGVAQPLPGADGDYLAFLPPAQIESYVRTAREHGMLLFLDVQVGWGDPLAEVRALAPYLAEPFVHVALDPEFATGPKGEAPGQAIGVLSSAQVNAVQAYLAGLVQAEGLPPKILVVHQFLERMLTTPQDFARYPGVSLVIDMDGFGAPDLKLSKYDKFALAPYAEYPGLKLFMRWDVPLMTPKDVLALPDPPRIVIYQ